MLQKLEENHNIAPQTSLKNSNKEMQLSFFDLNDPLLEELKADLLGLDLNTLTPIEALMKLNEMKARFKTNK